MLFLSRRVVWGNIFARSFLLDGLDFLYFLGEFLLLLEDMRGKCRNVRVE
jgi:hypothetical protein